MEPEISAVLAMCYKKVGVFGKTFLPATFNTPWSELHHEVINLLDSDDQRIVIAAPRNLGKTSFAKALCISGILYRDYEFIVYVSQSLESHALMQTENIKRELLSNGEIRKIFGNARVSDDDTGLDEAFSKHAWVAFGHTLVLPRGANQQVRGLLFDNYRPQLIIVDDLEDKRELENPENRRKLKDWFYADLMQCMDRYSNKWKVIYIDTLKHSESLMQELLTSSEWTSRRLEICDDDFVSKVPYLKTTEELKREAAEARKNGTLDIFYMEMRNLPVSRENQSFKQEYFIPYSETELRSTRSVESVVIVDPAKTIQIQNADTAIVGVGIDYASGLIYLRDCVSGKMYPEQIYEEMFAMALRLNAHVIGVEVTGLEEFIKQPILNEMQRRGPQYSFELVWLKARGGDPSGEKGKLKRIGALLPYYRQGFIRHNPTCCGKLEAQLMAFPRSGLVDVADAFAYIVEMLEIGGRYFTSPTPEVRDGEEVDEFAELEYDEPLEYVRLI